MIRTEAARTTTAVAAAGATSETIEIVVEQENS